jgi:indole-3-glycerol phosphate synthase
MPFLDKILASTRDRVAQGKAKYTAEVLDQRLAAAPPPRDFAAALSGESFSILGEIKRATPSAGVLVEQLNPAQTSTEYASGGAAAISVLTEPDFFRGSLDDIESARGAGLPVLRKDFVIDPWQLLETKAAGADAILLIVRIAGDDLGRLFEAAGAVGLQTLVEVYDERDLAAAVDVGAPVVGINSRDLDTFEVDPDRTARLAPQVPKGVTVIGLSGVSTRAEIKELESVGAHGALVGEALVTAADPAAKLRELRGES